MCSWSCMIVPLVYQRVENDVILLSGSIVGKGEPGGLQQDQNETSTLGGIFNLSLVREKVRKVQYYRTCDTWSLFMIAFNFVKAKVNLRRQCVMNSQPFWCFSSNNNNVIVFTGVGSTESLSLLFYLLPSAYSLSFLPRFHFSPYISTGLW